MRCRTNPYLRAHTPALRSALAAHGKHLDDVRPRHSASPQREPLAASLNP